MYSLKTVHLIKILKKKAKCTHIYTIVINKLPNFPTFQLSLKISCTQVSRKIIKVLQTE